MAQEQVQLEFVEEYKNTNDSTTNATMMLSQDDAKSTSMQPTTSQQLQTYEARKAELIAEMTKRLC